MKRDSWAYPPSMAVYRRYVRVYWRQCRLKWFSWLITGVYVAIGALWSILDQYGFMEVEGLYLLAGLPLSLFVLVTTVRPEA